MNCSTCGTDVFGDSVFCDSCGAIIDGSPGTHTEPTGAAFEPTQMISVADDPNEVSARAAPLVPNVQPPTPSSTSGPVPPPAAPRPAAPRRAPGPAFVPERQRSAIPIVGGALLLVGVVVLAIVIRGAFASEGEVAQSSSDDDAAAIDETDSDTDAESGDSGESDGESADGAAAIEVPDGFRLYEGACFAAAIPDSWSITEDSGTRSYGRRTAWSRGAEELFVDTSPLRDQSVTGREAADEQLNNRTTATSGLIEEPGRNDMWSYTYTRSGVPSIAIYFVEERGFGIVGSSRENPDGVMQEARQVSQSIRVTDPIC